MSIRTNPHNLNINNASQVLLIKQAGAFIQQQNWVNAGLKHSRHVFLNIDI